MKVYEYISKAKISDGRLQDHWSSGLAHLSQRLIGELIVYPWSGVRRRRRTVRRPSFTMFKHLLRNHLADQSQIL